MPEVYLHIKAGLSPSKKVGFICFTESQLKIIYVFYFILKTLFVLKICPFMSYFFFNYIGKQHDKKARVNSKFLTSYTGTQTTAMNILPDISKSKSNQTIVNRN